jgi:hypothetical protein
LIGITFPNYGQEIFFWRSDKVNVRHVIPERGREMYARLLLGNLKETDCLNVDVDGRIVLKWIFRM